MNSARFGRGFVWVTSLAVFAVSLRWLALPMELGMEHMMHYVPTLSWPLYGHLFFAPLALGLMPFQFWAGLRNRRPTVHRTMGYLYVVSIVIGGLSALALMREFQGDIVAAVGFVILAILWMYTTVRAVVAAKGKQFAVHRRWMIRSATLTFAAVVLRFIMPFLMIDGMTVAQTYTITGWASWLPSLIIVEWWMRRKAA